MIQRILLALSAVAIPVGASFAADVVGSDNLVVGYGTNNTYVRALHGAGVPGTSSMIFGNSTASGQYSGAFGYGHSVPAHHAFAMGWGSGLQGDWSIALGGGLFTASKSMVAVGMYNAYDVDTFGAADTWSRTGMDGSDPIFVIGNGTSTLRSNALVVTKDGHMTLIGKFSANNTITPGNFSLNGNITAGGNIVASGSNNQLLGQQANEPNDILTLGLADGRYLSTTGGGTIVGNVGVTGTTTLSGATTATGKITVSNTVTDIADTEIMTSSRLTFSPTSVAGNGKKVIGLYGRAEAAGQRNLTRELTSGAGINGIEGNVSHSGTGVVTAAVALSGYVQTSSTGVITKAVAFHSRSPSHTNIDTIGNAYGLYIQNQKTPAVTGNGYGVFDSSTANLNVFAGRTRIGDATDPATGIELDVAGDAAVSGNLAVTGDTSLASMAVSDAIVVGAFAEDDFDAALIVGNGQDEENRSNSLVIRKNGDAEVAGVLRVPESGDISQGEFR